PLRPTAVSPAREAWARLSAALHRPAPPTTTDAAATSEPAPALSAGRSLFRSLRCGACHASTEPVAPATPLRILAVRSSQIELAAGLRAHGEIAHVPLPDDDPSVSSLAAHLSETAQQDAATAVLHRASLAGSSGDEGHVLFDRLACAACHDAATQAAELARLKATRTADWVAYYLADPARANPAARMPNMRIAPREAASLATYLLEGAGETPAHGIDHAPVPCPFPDGPKPMPRAACGQALATAMQCSSCHAATPEHVLAASSLLAYGDTRDGPAALAGLDAHGAKAGRGALRFSLSDGERRALATFLVSQRTSHVLANFVPHGELWESARGAQLYEELRCAGCHSDEVKDDARGPSLFGEGLRTRPQWLIDFLRDPAHHAVLPAFHPEWAYRDLIPPDRASSRMPSYRLSDGDVTALVHFFTARDGASYPYATTTTPALAGEELTSAIGELSHKDRGACLTCHTVAVPDVDRARAEGDKLAAPLSLAHDRLRPEWIEACILQPDVWVGPKMPVLFRDPFGPPLPWPVASEPPANALEQIDRLRDLVLMLRERTVLPPAGAEGHSPALGLGEL
ncbi:MAG TPA: cytochrome c, partial [Polyangiaceae bacterium]|nr:cytochrome c [Polyangiaceae bacterium]